MMKSPPTASFVVAQAEFLLQFLVIPFDDPAMFGQVHEFHQRRYRPAGWIASIWWVPIPRLAIRSATILPDAVPIASSRDAQDAPARRQSGTAVSASPLAAKSLSSRLRRAATGQALSLRPVGASHRAVAVCGDVPCCLCVPALVSALRPASRPSRCSGFPRHRSSPISSAPRGNRCRFRSRHRPAPRPAGCLAHARAGSGRGRFLVWSETESSPARPVFFRRWRSSIQDSGRYRRYATGILAFSVVTERLTATRQLSCLPTWPQYCRATPTDSRPFFGNPVSSTTHATTGSRRSMAGITKSRQRSKTASSLQGASATT